MGQSAPPTQLSASNDTGLSPHTAYSIGAGNINLSNGNLNLEIPLINLPGRAGNTLNISAQYDSKNWVPHYVITTDGSEIVYTWQIEQRDTQLGSLGWRFNIDEIIQGGWETDENGNHSGDKPNIVVLKDGSKHSVGENRYGAGQSLDSEDASSIFQDTGQGPLAYRTKNGDLYSSNYIDPNGNIFSKDTLGRDVTITNSGGYPHLIQYKDSNGVTQTITLNYTTLTLFQTAAGQYHTNNPPFSDPAPSTGMYIVRVSRPAMNSQYVLLTSIVLADNTQYSFSYNGYGELTQITYPTGGYTQYAYGVFTHRENFWWGPGLYKKADFREVTSRTICDGAGLCGTTTYTPTIDQNKVNNDKMDVVEASGTSAAHLTRHQFTQASVAGEVCDKFYFPRETSVSSYAGSTTSTQLLRTVTTLYNSYTGGACADSYLPTRITTYLYDVGATPLVKKEEFDYDTYTAHVFYPFTSDPSIQTAQNVSVPIDNVIAHRAYDWGSGAPGPLIRTTQTDWLKTSAYVQAHILDRKTRVAVLDSSGTKKSETKFEYDYYTEGLTASNAVNHLTMGNTRGNLTAIDQWVDSTNSYLETRFQYDDAGNARKATDPKGNITQMSYGDNWNGTTNSCAPKDVATGSYGPGAAYLSGVTNAAGHVFTASYNSCTGTMASFQDPNLQNTSFTYDLLNRTTDISYQADGGEIKLSYPNATTVKREEKRTATLDWITQWTYFDGLGRVKQTQLGDSSDGDVFVDTQYNAHGQVWKVWNPHRAGSLGTDGYTTYTYDPLGRTISILQPDGVSTVSTSYLGNTSTVTDEVGKKRKTVVDGLGRLIQVFEDPTGLNYEADYKYDVLGNLTCVEQHGSVTGASFYGCTTPGYNDATSSWRMRRFTYDSLSRLTYAKNPESGIITYTYPTPSSLCSGDPSAVCTKTDARSIITTYAYVDPLNRLTGKSYQNANGELPVTYTYDSTAGGNMGKGRRTGMSVGTSGNSASWAFDGRGRVSQVTRTVNGYIKLITYTYNPDSSVKSITYPSNKTVNYTYNPAGRAIQAHDVGLNIDYVSPYSGSMFYWPSGALNAARLGANITLNNGYSPRLQPTTMTATGGAITLMSRTYDFIGNQTDNGETGNNGNVYGVTDNIDALNLSNRPIGSAKFRYDKLNRISQFKTTGTDCTSMGGLKNSGNTYSVDPWGNLTNKGPVTGLTGCIAESLNEAVEITNRFTPSDPVYGRYDASGNMVQYGAYSFDAENRIASGGGLTFKYDGDGNRVSKTGSTNELYWLGTGADALAESDAGGNLVSEYIFFGGKRVARVDTSNPTHPVYYISDHLGSTTVLANDDGTPKGETMYYPYGGVRWSNVTDTNHYKYTGKERDAETGLDYFGARYYGSNMGRWLSPDWAANAVAVPYANFGNPQSLNLYSYVRNSPMSLADLDGHDTDGHKYSNALAYEGDIRWGDDSPSLVGHTFGMENQQTTTGADLISGNFIIVGERPLLLDWPADQFFHTYISIPNVIDGKWDGTFTTFGVLGEIKDGKGTKDNQQVRKNDKLNRNAPKKGSTRNHAYLVRVTDSQRQELAKGADYWTGHTCPSCGENYRRGPDNAYNSNTWVYNMLIHNPAGRIEPPRIASPAPGWNVNDVGANYYPQ
jgi:RHS repeat-associated protein